MTPYLRFRKEHYYFRLRVPADLRSIIQSTEIIKSLHKKTSSPPVFQRPACYLRLIQDVLGVRTIAEITREEVRKHRDTLWWYVWHLAQLW
jgi:hypothetical protein